MKQFIKRLKDAISVLIGQKYASKWPDRTKRGGREMNEDEERMVYARMEAAKAWCQDKTSSLIMNVELCEEFAKVLVEHMYEPHLGCATTGEILEELRARSDLEYKTINRI